MEKEYREFSLDTMEVDVDMGPAIVECLLHTIFFVRLFGVVEPVDVEIGGLNLWYVRVNDGAIETEVKEKARAFQELQGTGKSSGEVVLRFFDKKNRSTGWFSQQEGWEKWTIKITFSGRGPRTASRMELSPKDKKTLAEQVVRRINFILASAKSQHDHIPKVEDGPFAHAIELPLVQPKSVWSSFFN